MENKVFVVDDVVEIVELVECEKDDRFNTLTRRSEFITYPKTSKLRESKVGDICSITNIEGDLLLINNHDSREGLVINSNNVKLRKDLIDFKSGDIVKRINFGVIGLEVGDEIEVIAVSPIDLYTKGCDSGFSKRHFIKVDKQKELEKTIDTDLNKVKIEDININNDICVGDKVIRKTNYIHCGMGKDDIGTVTEITDCGSIRLEEYPGKHSKSSLRKYDEKYEIRSLQKQINKLQKELDKKKDKFEYGSYNNISISNNQIQEMLNKMNSNLNLKTSVNIINRNEVKVELYDTVSKKNIGIGRCVCKEGDKFNLQTGFEIAMLRALEKANKRRICKLIQKTM